MQTKVNKKFKSILSPQEIETAYEEIKKACTRKILTPANSPDMRKVKEIFNKYFNINEPLLDINEPIISSTFSPLMTTSWLGYADETKELLNLKADPIICNNNNNSALHIAIGNNKFLVFNALMKNNEKIVNIKNSHGQTPLMIAAESGALDIVKELVEKYKANIHEKDANNKTAIDYAKERQEYNIEKYLRFYILDTQLETKQVSKKINKI